MKNIKVKSCRPEEIENMSMAIIESEVPEPRQFQGIEWLIARRMVHTTADFDLLNHIMFHPKAVEAGLKALKAGCSIFTDTDMARKGIPLRRMNPLGCAVNCLMQDGETGPLAAKNGTTRAQAAVDLALERSGLGMDTIYVVGNAPTALIRLLEWIEAGKAAPALVVGAPVGFVNAEESKELLLAQNQVPYITIRGRKGGSALAACVINQLAHCLLNPKS